MLKSVSHIFIWSFISVAIWVSCKSKHNPPSLEEGGQVYRDKCALCHGYDRGSGSYNPSLFQMVKTNKKVLNKMLVRALADSIHVGQVPIKSDEINDVKYFIATYDGTIY